MGIRWVVSNRCGAARVAFALAALLPATAVALAVEDKPLPEAAAILDKFVAVTGGKDAYAKLKNSVTKGTVEFVGAGITGPITTYRARPNKTTVTVEAKGYGRIQEGVDGKVAWSRSTMSGPQIKQGEEYAAAMREATFDGAVLWRKLYQADTLAAVRVGGKMCYKVKLAPKEGHPIYQYYDQKSHLLVKFDTQRQTAMGSVSVSTVLSDWREVDGIRVPFEVRQSIGDFQQLKIVTKSIEHNAEIAAEQFALPEEIKQLVAKRSGK